MKKILRFKPEKRKQLPINVHKPPGPLRYRPINTCPPPISPATLQEISNLPSKDYTKEMESISTEISEECEIFLKLTQKLQNHLQNPSFKSPSQESSSSSSQDIALYAPASIKQLKSEIEKCEKDIKLETKNQKKLQNKLKKAESINKSLKEELDLEDIRKSHITQRIEVTLPYASQLQNQLSLAEKSLSQSSYYIKSLCLQCETEKHYLDLELGQIAQLNKTISSLISNRKKFEKYN